MAHLRYMVFVLLAFPASVLLDHSRTKRALLFPRLSVLQFTCGLSVPAILPARSINLSLCLQVNYNFPYNITNFMPKVVQAKSNSDVDLSRELLYEYIVKFLESLGFNGRDCLLRMICEISESPMHLNHAENLLEKIVHFLFTPSLDLKRNNGFSEALLGAETSGRTGEQCENNYSNCPVSLVNVFTSKYIV